MRCYKIFIFIISIFFTNILMSQDTIIDPFSPEILTESRLIELDCQYCESSMQGYIRVILTFKDSISPLKLDDVKLSDVVIIDSITREVIYKYSSKDVELNNNYSKFINDMIVKIKHNKYYISADKNKKYFTRRTDYVFPFNIKAIR